MRAKDALLLANARAEVPQQSTQVMFHIVHRALAGHKDILATMSPYEANALKPLGYAVTRISPTKFLISWASADSLSTPPRTDAL